MTTTTHHGHRHVRHHADCDGAIEQLITFVATVFSRLPLAFVQPSAAFASLMTSVRVFASLGFFAVFLYPVREDVRIQTLGLGDGHVTSLLCHGFIQVDLEEQRDSDGLVLLSGARHLGIVERGCRRDPGLGVTHECGSRGVWGV